VKCYNGIFVRLQILSYSSVYLGGSYPHARCATSGEVKKYQHPSSSSSPSRFFLLLRIFNQFGYLLNSFDVLDLQEDHISSDMHRHLSIILFEDHVWFKDRWMVASLCDE
jgi:hypothetical protein